jgi:hypothetical protein
MNHHWYSNLNIELEAVLPWLMLFIPLAIVLSLIKKY